MNPPVFHPLVRTAAWSLSAAGVAVLVACVGGTAGVAGNTGPAQLAPPVQAAATGQAAAWPTQHAPAAEPAVQARQALLTPALQAGQPVYNPVDGRFYGITHQPGRRGSLWRLNPDTNTVDLLMRLNGSSLAVAAAPAQARRAAHAPAEPRTAHQAQGAWLSNPVVSADGRSLYLVADLGGRFLRGVVMHVDIHPASPTAGQAATVFTFADQALPAEDGCAEPAARTGYQLAWGADEPAGPALLLSRGRVQPVRLPLPASLVVATEAPASDTSACSLALLPTRADQAAQAWDLAEAVREAAPWPAPTAPGLSSRALATGAGGWPHAALAGVHAANPVPGGPSRYLVSVAPAWAGQPLAVLTRDLATGHTTRAPLDLAAAALQPGPWMPLGDGLALARVARAPAGAVGARQGSIGGLIDTETPAQGLALVDAASGRISRLASHRAPLQSAQDLVQLADGSLWDVRLEPGRQGGAWRTVYRIDRHSLAATASFSLADSGALPMGTGFQAGQAGAGVPSPYAVAGRGQALYLGTHVTQAAQAAQAARQAGQARRPAPHPQLRLNCVRTDLPGQGAAHAALVKLPLGQLPPGLARLGQAARDTSGKPSRSPQPSPPGPLPQMVAGPTHAPAQGAIYLATVQPGRDGAPDTAALHEVDRGLPDAALCRRAPQVVTLVDGLTDLPVTRVLATRDGALLYATRSGKLMRLDPDQRRVQAVADLRAPGAGQHQWVAALDDVGPGRLDALVQAQDARGRPLGQHRVQVAIGSASGRAQAQASRAAGLRVSQAP